MRFEVETGAVSAAGARQQQAAGRIRELSGRLANASSAACSAGDPAVNAALGTCLLSWQKSLEMLSESVGTLATNLSGAGAAYTGTDEQAIPGG
jgi:uncharacterized protein YukE